MSLNWALWRLAAGTVSSRPLGVFRGAIGVVAVVQGVELAANLGEQRFAWAGLELSPSVWPLVATLWFVAALALGVGYRSRLAAAGIAGLTAFVCLFTALYSNHLYLLGTLAVLLSLSDCGAYASLDSRRTGIRDEVARAPVTLIEIQVSIVYLFAALAKLNAKFVPGNVLFYYSHNALALPSLEPLAAYFPLFMGLAVSVICLELFVAVGLWVERVRPAVFGIGLVLHAGMIATLSGSYATVGRLGVFAALTLSCYLLFVRAPLHGRVVVWDHSCSFCATCVRWFKRLDWLGAFRFVRLNDVEEYRHLGVTPESAAEALQLVELDGRVYGGFDAVRRVLQVVPVSFLWAPYLALPGVRAIGDRAYRNVAAHRTCQVSFAP